MGQIITFAQQKGGAGKTTLLAHLAHAWASEGRKVAVVDLDTQASLTQWAGLGSLPLTMVETKDYRAGGDIKSAARSHDLVLVDCPGNASAMLDAALRESHLVVAPCQPTVMDVWATRAILTLAGKAKVPVRVVLNRVPARGQAAEEAAAMLAGNGASVLASRLGNRMAFQTGFARGTTALGLGRSPAMAEVQALRGELDGVLAGL
jgi:chromosome partitioning protein